MADQYLKDKEEQESLQKIIARNAKLRAAGQDTDDNEDEDAPGAEEDTPEGDEQEVSPEQHEDESSGAEDVSYDTPEGSEEGAVITPEPAHPQMKGIPGKGDVDRTPGASAETGGEAGPSGKKTTPLTDLQSKFRSQGTQDKDQPVAGSPIKGQEVTNESPSTSVSQAKVQKLQQDITDDPAGKGQANVNATKDSVNRNVPDGPDKSDLQKRLDVLDARYNDAVRNYKDQMNRTQWAQVAETFSHALAQIGAAEQGLRTNVNMSGLPFNKTDWDKHYDSIARGLDVQLKGIGRQERSAIQAARAEQYPAVQAAKIGAQQQMEQGREATKVKVAEIQAKSRGAKPTSNAQEIRLNSKDADNELKAGSLGLQNAVRIRDNTGKSDDIAKSNAQVEADFGGEVPTVPGKFFGKNPDFDGIVKAYSTRADMLKANKSAALQGKAYNPVPSVQDIYNQQKQQASAPQGQAGQQQQAPAAVAGPQTPAPAAGQQQPQKPAAPQQPQQASAPAQTPAGHIRVRLKNGMTGSIPAEQFNPSTMQKI